MRTLHHHRDFIPSGFFALRTPLLPYSELLAWSAGLQAPTVRDDPAALEQAVAADRQVLRDRLRHALMRPAVRDAIFVASPDLDDGFERWLHDPESEKGRRAERALARYYQRMAARATPFGLFAGCSVGTIGAASQLTLAARATYRRHTRLDMDYLYALIDVLDRDAAVRQAVLYYPNTSLYRAAGRVRYVETRLRGDVRAHFLVAVEETDYLNSVLERTQSGATKDALAAAIVADDPAIDPAEAEAYLEALIDNQLVVSELSLVVTGQEPIHTLLEQLHRRAAAPLVRQRLEQVREALAAIDTAGLGVPSHAYRAIAHTLEELPAQVTLPRLFQVDMVKPTEGLAIGQHVIDEVTRAIEILRTVASPSAQGQSELRSFRDAFVARYQDGQEVPLVVALDEELGIGFHPSASPNADASPLLSGLLFPPSAPAETVAWQPRHAFLLGKLHAALASGAQEMTLEAQDLAKLPSPEALPLPDAFSVMASLVAPSAEALQRGEFRLLFEGAAGPSGARLLGRFCHADAQLHAEVAQHLRAEEAFAPDAVFAEVVHLPEGRVGNILLRPLMRAYEIPFLGKSGADAEHQIPITDLTVSVSNGRVVLRSGRLGKEVIPRLTSAHHYGARSLGLYRFLCSIQSQGVTRGLGWNWGPLEDAPFLPRVSSGRIIFARARWRVTHAELQAFAQVHSNSAALFACVQQWRATRHVPRFAVLVEYDNELPIDFDNILSIETFVSAVKQRDGALLAEALPGPEALCVSGPEGLFTHEIAIPFISTRAARQADATPAPHVFTAPHRVQRAFPPGSEWLYAKLYTGTATADRALIDVVGPVAAQAMATGAADNWFFLRYSDPEWHLRLRFHGDPQRLNREVVPLLQAAVRPLLESGQVWRLQYDTYEREIARYGGDVGILHAEKLFHIDSEAVLQIVESYAGDEGADARWRLAFYGIDALLTDLGCDLTAKLEIMQEMRRGFGKEFRADSTDLKHQLGKRYMAERKALEAASAAQGADGPLAHGFAILRARSARLAPLIATLQADAACGKLTSPLNKVTHSYVHMGVNRLLRSAQRAQELVLYDFLGRWYASQRARAHSQP